jgi:hypothetical protein
LDPKADQTRREAHRDQTAETPGRGGGVQILVAVVPDSIELGRHPSLFSASVLPFKRNVTPRTKAQLADTKSQTTASAADLQLLRCHRMKKLNRTLAVISAGSAFHLGALELRADEQLFGFVRGAETLPKGQSELYQFATFRTGKNEGNYSGMDFETEIEHGFTDRFQASLSLENRYIYNRGVHGDRDALNDTEAYRFGGVSSALKYRLLSPFKDPIGVALRLEGGYLLHDEVDGLPEHEGYIAPEIDLQKNFRDDTLITEMWMGTEWAWGKKPAEQYPRELAFQGGLGASYRVARNWFIGVESNIRAEYPLFKLSQFEHYVIYAGPSIHYSAKRWWATLTVVHQVWGGGIGEPLDGKTYAEETDWQIRLKVGLNF